MDIKISEQEVKDFIKEQFDMEDFANIMCNDSDWLNGVLAENLVKKIKIDRKELVEACVYEYFRDSQIRWSDLEEEVYKEVAKQLAQKLINQTSIEIKEK